MAKPSNPDHHDQPDQVAEPTNPDRRSVLKGMAAGAVGAGLAATGWNRNAQADDTPAPPPMIATPSRTTKRNPYAASFPIWQLDRPKAALPSSYFWTWDHSTNWCWDDPGIFNHGCYNKYLKQPETYLLDYQRLTDLCTGLGFKGFLVWGFLRESHGGIDHAKRITAYAAERNVCVMPGVGTNWYGGVYYEGDHPYNIETFLAKDPDARSIDENGNPRPNSICPRHPGFQAWMSEGLHWLFREFPVGGANLENGDFMVCYCPRCKAASDGWPADVPAFWRFQSLGYGTALRAIEDQLDDKFVTWATYKGFLPGEPKTNTNKHAYMECTRLDFVDKFPAKSVCQWTLTAMVRQPPLPMNRFLDNGTPDEFLESDIWPANVKPPTKRSVGFIHQGSQWCPPPRYNQIISVIKEGCLRAYRAGLEGVSIHGEMSTMHVPWALNYLAFSHFTHWPEDSLRDFGRKTLGQILRTPDDGEHFCELMAAWEAGTVTEQQKKDLKSIQRDHRSAVEGRGPDLAPFRFWNWLHQLASGYQDTQTVSSF